MSNLPDNYDPAAWHAQWGRDLPTPDDAAYSAAAMVELARMLGMDWQEAADVLEMHAPEEDERNAALMHYHGQPARVWATLMMDAAAYARLRTVGGRA